MREKERERERESERVRKVFFLLVLRKEAEKINRDMGSSK